VLIASGAITLVLTGWARPRLGHPDPEYGCLASSHLRRGERALGALGVTVVVIGGLLACEAPGPSHAEMVLCVSEDRTVLVVGAVRSTRW